MAPCKLFTFTRRGAIRRRKSARIEGIEKYDFDELAKIDESPRERRRFLAFAHLREGKTFTGPGASAGVKFRSLMKWIERFKNGRFQKAKR